LILNQVSFPSYQKPFDACNAVDSYPWMVWFNDEGKIAGIPEILHFEDKGLMESDKGYNSICVLTVGHLSFEGSRSINEMNQH
jgi:hypothetical protein